MLTRPGDGIIVPFPTYYYRNDVTCVNRYYTGFQMKNDNGYYTFDWDAFEKLCKEPQNTMVILQQPHPHPAIGGRAQFVEEQCPGDVAVPDVVLRVDAALGPACQQHTRGEGVLTVIEQMQSGQPRMPGSAVGQRPPNRGIGGIRQRL